jgi:hypothetical protein
MLKERTWRINEKALALFGMTPSEFDALFA